MADIAIRVENLSKQYRIGKAQQRQDTLRDALVAGLRGSKQRLWSVMRRPSPDEGGSRRTNDEHIWALKDVSFEVQRGEVLGVIGRNGAGKSTLLKILSQITEPSEGRVELNGRVGSLLEVGTGFHPELTGRENIYLNGAILGMQRRQLERRFHEIVAFAEVERFLDTPVKRYSSGMYVRLAFAVAAHLDPEILLVDEVLAVGDAEFQRKCLGKMGDVANQGRTVLFVSHNMAAVTNLCGRAILLNGGILTSTGSAQDVAQAYVGGLKTIDNADLRRIAGREGNGKMRIVGLRMLNDERGSIRTPVCGQDVSFEILYEGEEELQGKTVVVSIAFFNTVGQPLFLCRSDLQGTDFRDLPSVGSVFCRIRRFPLPPGRFRVNLYCEVNGTIADWIKDALAIDVAEGDFFGSGRLPSRGRGDLLVEHEWLAAWS